MAHRPIQRKQAQRLRRAMTRSELPRFIDLVQYLKDRRYADTTGQAEKIILAGRVRSDSHKLGVVQATVAAPLTLAQQMAGKEVQFETKDVVQRYIPASVRDTITVLAS